MRKGLATWMLLVLLALPFFPFAGKILNVSPCISGLLLTVGAPKPGSYLFIFGISKLYAHFSLKPGSFVVGNSVPGGTCTGIDFGLITGTITVVGTSF